MVEPTMELLDWFRKQVEQADGDVLAEMLHIFAETLMDTDAQSLCNAGFNEKSPDRTNTRNGYRSHAWDTRAGTIDLAVPKLRQGSYSCHHENRALKIVGVGRKNKSCGPSIPDSKTSYRPMWTYK
jgi:transposase-like protein